MKKQAILTPKQKEVILVGLKAISETFRVMSTVDMSQDKQQRNEHLYKVTVELLETYKSFINKFPTAWRNLNRPEAPGYLAAAHACQKNFLQLQGLQEGLLAERLGLKENPEFAARIILYNVWISHNWAFKCFAGVVPPAKPMMTAEEYEGLYGEISLALYYKVAAHEGIQQG